LYSDGLSSKDIEFMFILSSDSNWCFPCGGCRQVIIELMDSNTPIYICNQNKELFETSPLQLLPNAFNNI
jgi:cytidine deaminase